MHEDPPAEAAELDDVRQLAAAISHEVRNAVTGVRGAIGIISERLPATSPDRSVIARIVARLDEVSQRMEDLSLFANPQPPIREPTMVADVFAAVGRRFPDVRVSIEGDNPSIDVDRRHLVHAVAQLVDNAARYDPEGPIVLRCVALEDVVELFVADGGPGIEESLREQIFEAFVSTESNRTGIGLTVARRVARAHGGDLEVVVGPGAVFVMRLPRTEK